MTQSSTSSRTQAANVTLKRTPGRSEVSKKVEKASICESGKKESPKDVKKLRKGREDGKEESPKDLKKLRKGTDEENPKEEAVAKHSLRLSSVRVQVTDIAHKKTVKEEKVCPSVKTSSKDNVKTTAKGKQQNIGKKKKSSTESDDEEEPVRASNKEKHMLDRSNVKHSGTEMVTGTKEANKTKEKSASVKQSNMAQERAKDAPQRNTIVEGINPDISFLKTVLATRVNI